MFHSPMISVKLFRRLCHLYEKCCPVKYTERISLGRSDVANDEDKKNSIKGAL